MPRGKRFIILWMVVALSALGCGMRTSGPVMSFAGPSRMRPADRDEPPAAADRDEPRPAPVVVERPKRAAVDPGADALVDAILKSLADPARGPDGDARVGLARLRNQSHCSAREFAAFRERLARLLDRPGRFARIRFIADPDQTVEYELRGTAYLLTAGGFDQWELYLSLYRTGQAWPVWQADGPIRLLRQRRPGTPEIFSPR
ncbi:MAG: hypothetical protein ACYS0G_04645 [Planctomycetota bacterium]|jgi:hypothetical protein